MDRGLRQILEGTQQDKIQKNSDGQSYARTLAAQAFSYQIVHHGRYEENGCEPDPPRQIERVACDQESSSSDWPRSDLCQDHGAQQECHSVRDDSNQVSSVCIENLAGCGALRVLAANSIRAGETRIKNNSARTLLQERDLIGYTSHP